MTRRSKRSSMLNLSVKEVFRENLMNITLGSPSTQDAGSSPPGQQGEELSQNKTRILNKSPYVVGVKGVCALFVIRP